MNLQCLHNFRKGTASLAAAFLFLAASGYASPQRVNFDKDWKFAFGHAADPAKDFGCGTEYFNYLTKAASIHNEGPYSEKFDDSDWLEVRLPHDFVVDLPFSRDASHSHGYKTAGWRYPETSVGWYRKSFHIPAEDLGQHFSLQFDGAFRDSKVWVNGFYLGSEPSGYATQVYDITDYLNYGGDNVVAVRTDASLEEGWFYEGGGIYRHVWLDKRAPVHIAPFGIFIHADVGAPYQSAIVTVETTIDNKSLSNAEYDIRQTLIAPDGSSVRIPAVHEADLRPQDSKTSVSVMNISQPQLWDVDNPQLYTLETEILINGEIADRRITKTGLRDVRFDPDKGFLLNGRSVKLKGFNMHQDHPGVGAAIPDALQSYRLRQLKALGANAYRSSHNPMTPAMLDACDSLGILVIEENRLTGINDEHVRLLKRMIERDRNHPSIILWSVGNEEWGTEWKDFGARITATMREHCHRLDSTRLMTVATSSGPRIVETADVAGYNYILQNPVDEHRANYPHRIAVGSEETTGCGARGVYFDNHEAGYMKAINRSPSGSDSLLNAIERGWKFYDARPWLGGLFYWTGFDYRGEANPMVYPATGSQFGVLDYCGFPKDEAYYLKAVWTDEPVLHILPHWNLRGHEGEEIDVWAYSNMDEVELFLNGRNLGRKKMPANSHLSWKAVYEPGALKAVGYKDGRKVLTKTIETTGEPASLLLSSDRSAIRADGEDVAVISVEILDKKGREVPDANVPLSLRLEGDGIILGAGNGDPAFLIAERPAPGADRMQFEIPSFNGRAQILIQASETPGSAVLTVESPGIKPQTINITTR